MSGGFCGEGVVVEGGCCVWCCSDYRGAPTIEVLRPSRCSDRGGLVMLGYHGGTRFPLIFLPTTVHLN